MSRRVRTGQRKRSNAIYIVPILVVVTGVVGYYIFTSSGTSGGTSPLIGQPVSATVLSDLSGVSMSTLNQVGRGSSAVNSPTATGSSTPLTLNGKAEVLYMGAEYCPYCAAERWAMIVALDKFGNFTGIQYMQSSSTDVYANTPTFTFVGATYTSNYVAFVTVEQQDRSQQALQSATAEETALLTTYDKPGTIPFVDFGNSYTITSSQYIPSALRVGNSETGAPYNWTQIAPQLNNASSIFAQNVDGAANRIISAICKIDGNAPSSVCSQGAAQTLSYARAPPSGGSQLLVSDVVSGGTRSSAEAPRLVSNRSAAQRI
jgi:thiol-disulfide isomerase/thioredoxin